MTIHPDSHLSYSMMDRGIILPPLREDINGFLKDIERMMLKEVGLSLCDVTKFSLSWGEVIVEGKVFRIVYR